MRDIKTGETYNHPLLGNIVAEAVDDEKPAYPGAGRKIICRQPHSGEIFKVYPRSLKTPAEVKQERRMERLDREEGERLLSEMQEILGYGVDAPLSYITPSLAVITFDEEAIDNLLSLCGAKPLTDDKRPSQTSDEAEWVYRATLLGRRVRRALGVGRSGDHTGYALANQGKQAQAQITFFSGELEKAVIKLKEAKEGPKASALSGLI